MTTHGQPTRKVWQRRHLRIHRPNTVVPPDQKPIAQLVIYREAIVYIKREQRGALRSHLVHPDAVAQTLARAPVVSGLLLPNTLATGRIDGTPYFVLYVPPRVIDLQTPSQTYTIPTPPLVWAGCGHDFRIWALGEVGYPTQPNLPLWVAPFPNSYKNGSICWGDVGDRPAASPQVLLKVLKLFLEDSMFNLHVANGKSVRFPNSVIALYDELKREMALDPTQPYPYPLDDLMPAELSLGWVLNGGPWRRS